VAVRVGHELFRLRDDRNNQQVRSWLALLDEVPSVPSDVRVVSLYGRDRLLGERSPVDESLAGITETPWALSRVLTDTRGEFTHALGGHPFVPVCFERTPDPETLRVTTMFNDEVIPIRSLLAAEIMDEELAVIDEIAFGDDIVRLPLAAQVADPSLKRLRVVSEGDRACRIFGGPFS
jgi:hypothetical protein